MSHTTTALLTARLARHASWTTLVTAVSFSAASPLVAQNVLASAQQFGVLGAASVSNTGPTTIKGALGVFPGTTISGLGSIVLFGALHQTDLVAQQAQSDAASAYAQLAAQLSTTNLTGQNLGGLILSPGVYTFNAAAQLTGNLVLDFLTNPSGSFVFQIGTTLGTAIASTVTVVNGNSQSGVYFQVGSSATLGTGSMFRGNLIAGQSITVGSGASIVCGRAIALNGAVTLNTDVISNDCRNGGDFGTGSSDFGSIGFSGGSGLSSVPEPTTLALLGSSCLALVGFVRRVRRTHA